MRCIFFVYILLCGPFGSSRLSASEESNNIEASSEGAHQFVSGLGSSNLHSRQNPPLERVRTQIDGIKNAIASLPDRYRYKRVLKIILQKLRGDSSSDSMIIGFAGICAISKLLAVTVDHLLQNNPERFCPANSQSTCLPCLGLSTYQVRNRLLKIRVKADALYQATLPTVTLLEKDGAVWRLRFWLRELVYETELSDIGLSQPLPLVAGGEIRDSLGKNIMKTLELTGVNVDSCLSAKLVKEHDLLNYLIRDELFESLRSTHASKAKVEDDMSKDPKAIFVQRLLRECSVAWRDRSIIWDFALGLKKDFFEDDKIDLGLSENVRKKFSLIDLNERNNEENLDKWLKNASVAYRQLSKDIYDQYLSENFTANAGPQ